MAGRERLAEFETSEPVTTGRFRLHVPRGQALVPLPSTYPTLEDAKRAFEEASGVSPYCLIGLDSASPQSGLFKKEATAFQVMGRVQGETVTWKSLSENQAPTPARPGHRR
jgi:hypothetical protein